MKFIKKFCVAAALMAAVLTASHCEAQIGTYVAPRATTLSSGTLGTNVATNSIVLYGTNFLNYSGFHRPQFQLTEVNTNGAGTYGTITVTAQPIFAFGGGYTNTYLGTNVVNSTATTNLFSQTCGSATTNIDYYSLDWPQADSVAGWLIKLTYNGTNANGVFPVDYQLDQFIAP